MKTTFLGKCTFGASVLLLPVLASCTPQAPANPPPPATNSSTATQGDPVMLTEAAPADVAANVPDPASPALAVPPPAAADPMPDAPGTVTTPGGLPPNIYPTSPLAQVIRLSQAGVDESVIMTFVINSSGTFNLDSDKIIYLRDIGLPSGIITAMMQRDRQLQQQMAAANPPPAEPPPGTDTTAPTEPPPPTVEETAPPPAEVTTTYFYDTLAPYGSWVYVDGYGQCWRPSVCMYNPGWRPYCDQGRWIYTDCGWYWYSDYTWGWAPFHYGRWFQHPHWGWCWAPDTVWGPSWVTWRYSSGYCGWAPLPPFSTYRAGIGFFYRGGSVSIGFNWGLGEDCFTFVPTPYFCDPYPRRHCVAPAQVTQIFNQTTVINNFNVHDHRFVNGGIGPEHITAITHNPIHPVAIRNAPGPGVQGSRGDQLSRDGGTLTISPPPRPWSPVQNHPPQPNDSRPVTPSRPVHLPPVPVVTTHGPQDNNPIRVPPQYPSSPANYNPPPVPNYDNRRYTPRQWEQVRPAGTTRGNANNAGAPPFASPSNPGQPGGYEAGRYNTPGTAPIPAQTQHSQPASPASSPPAPRSSGQNQNQNNSGNNSANNPGIVPGSGPAYGPRR